MSLGIGKEAAKANLRMVPVAEPDEASEQEPLPSVSAESPAPEATAALQERPASAGRRKTANKREVLSGSIDEDSVAGTLARAPSNRFVPEEAPVIMVPKPLPRVLLVHTGGTLGMDAESSFTKDDTGHVHVRPGTGGNYVSGLQPGRMLSNIKQVVPELSIFADLDLKVAFNRDSCRVGPKEWVKLAQMLHNNRDYYDAFMLVHGTDTLAYTASALSIMLAGFRKPIVMTGSQLPLAMPRSDARQNLIDSMTCATSAFSPPHTQLSEVAVCFGGRLLR